MQTLHRSTLPFDFKFWRACKKAKGNMIQITRLWNVADHQNNPESLWSMLQVICPEAFDDPRNPNTLRFTYHQS